MALLLVLLSPNKNPLVLGPKLALHFISVFILKGVSGPKLLSFEQIWLHVASFKSEGFLVLPF